MKYPGGYQIIDLKGLNFTGGVVLSDPDLIQKVKYAFECRKPLYIANYTCDLSYPRGPLLMEYDGNIAGFSHSFIEGEDVAAYVDLLSTGEDEYTLAIHKL